MAEYAKQVVSERSHALLDVFADAHFDCGEWDNDADETYEGVSMRATAAEVALADFIAELETKCDTPAAMSKPDEKIIDLMQALKDSLAKSKARESNQRRSPIVGESVRESLEADTQIEPAAQ